MPKSMSISPNGESHQIPPGFRFHPTEEELLNYYLRKKVSCEKIDLDVILEVDLNKLEPWEIIEKCKIGTTPQNEWYFFSQKDKKYPTGTRTNRATVAGFWKATGRDKNIYSNGKWIGMRKTLVFYEGRAPHGKRLDWIMHEYKLKDYINFSKVSNNVGEASHQEEDWVVCRIFKKKHTHKTLENPSFNEQYETTNTAIINGQDSNTIEMDTPFTNWVLLDQLIASQLNAQISCDGDGGPCFHATELDLQFPQFQDYNNQIDLWSFSPSLSNPF